jgi:hypothetical protein
MENGTREQDVGLLILGRGCMGNGNLEIFAFSKWDGDVVTE